MKDKREIGSPSTHFGFCVVQVRVRFALRNAANPSAAPFFSLHAFDTASAGGWVIDRHGAKATRVAVVDPAQSITPLAAPQPTGRCISDAQPENALCTNAASGKKARQECICRVMCSVPQIAQCWRGDLQPSNFPTHGRKFIWRVLRALPCRMRSHAIPPEPCLEPCETWFKLRQVPYSWLSWSRKRLQNSFFCLFPPAETR